MVYFHSSSEELYVNLSLAQRSSIATTSSSEELKWVHHGYLAQGSSVSMGKLRGAIIRYNQTFQLSGA